MLQPLWEVQARPVSRSAAMGAECKRLRGVDAVGPDCGCSGEACALGVRLGFSPKRPTERSDSRLSLRQHDADFTKRQPSDAHTENACTHNEVTKSAKEGSINCVHEIDPKRPRAEAGESLLREGTDDPSDAPASDAAGVRGDARSDQANAVLRLLTDEVADLREALLAMRELASISHNGDPWYAENSDLDAAVIFAQASRALGEDRA